MNNDFLSVISQHGDPNKINDIRNMINELKREVDHNILNQATKRALNDNEVAFLRSRLPFKRLKINCSDIKVEEIHEDEDDDDGTVTDPLIAKAEIAKAEVANGQCGLEHRLAMMNLTNQ